MAGLLACSDEGGGSGSADAGLDVDATVDGAVDSDLDELDVGDAGDADVDLDDALCLEGTSGPLTPASGAALEISITDVLSYRLEVPANAVAADDTASLRCLDASVVPENVIPLSRPVEVDFRGRLATYARITMPFDRSALPEGARPSAIRLYIRPAGSERVVAVPAIDLQENMTRGFVSFSTRDAGIYQAGVTPDAGETYQREWQFRAITGVSMGCSGALMVGLRHPEAFDIIGAMGGPSDWTYLTHYIAEAGLGGFGTAPDFAETPPVEPTEEFEHTMEFDDFWSPTGEGSGGTFDRGEYLSILQDMALSFGNLAGEGPASPYLPAGVDPAELLRSAAERCPGTAETVLTIESGFYDDEYNPDGTRPVIMFCDGTSNRDRTLPFDRYCDLDDNGQPDEPNRGLYPGPEAQTRPVEIAWAVDLDGDGQRDPGEPVIRNLHEPFDDVGPDGLASRDEPGYDPVERPDPSDDDYDYFTNPGGTEGNWLYDAGEPFDDVGLDGVPDTPSTAEGGYDTGEGNDTFDYDPNLAALLAERDPHHTVHALTSDDWDHLTLYVDAGIRDLFNFGVATNHLAGQVALTGANMRIHNGFFSLANLDPEEDSYRFNEVEYGELGDHVYLRYGDPNADEEQICLGDGKHVGPPGQIANRLLTMLGFVTARFPGGELSPIEPPYPTPNGTYRFYSEALDALEEYSVILPPGYERTACTDTEDNDGDGLTDGDDPGCAHGMDNDEGEGLGSAYCSDGIDNDMDGAVDSGEDSDCLGPDDTSEWPAGSPLRDARFPVVYLLHGYGQTPDDLRATVVPFAGFMGGGLWQKVIVVYPDGFCGDNARNQCNDGIDNDADELIDGDDPGCAESSGRAEDGTSPPRCSDGVDNDRDGRVDDEDRGCVGPDGDDESDCVKGNFYTNHVAWPDGSTPGPAFEDALFDLVEHVDAVYRTRAPERYPATR